MFKGSMVALVTPMHDCQVDLPQLQALVDFHLAEGSHALIVAGTTGESGTLSYDEKRLVIQTVLEQVRDRVPVIAGTAANSTRDCIQLTQEAMHCGAHAALIMTPAYIRPTQEGLYRHYSLIAQAVPIPIILYNVPTRTACDLLPETVIRLAKISNIIGIKEATGDISRLHQIQDQCEGDIDVYSGDDLTAVDWMLAGAKGVISVTANIVPRMMAAICGLALDGEKTACLALHEQLLPLHRALFIESNPIPVKWALHRMGLISHELRLPLTPLSESYHPLLEDIMVQLKLIDETRSYEK